MRRFTRTAVVAAGILAFSGITAGAAQAVPPPPPPNQEYMVGGVDSCDAGIEEMQSMWPSLPDDPGRYTCHMDGGNTALVSYR